MSNRSEACGDRLGVTKIGDTPGDNREGYYMGQVVDEFRVEFVGWRISRSIIPDLVQTGVTASRDDGVQMAL
jgi:hypothetical protein